MKTHIKISIIFILSLVVLMPVVSTLHPVKVASGNAAEGMIQYSPEAANATNYYVTFHEYGLPSGMKWSVTLNGTTMNSTGILITFAVPDGSFQYQVRSENGYYSPSIGIVHVSGGNITRGLTFSPINTPFETIQLFFEGAGIGGIIGATAASMFLRKKKN